MAATLATMTAIEAKGTNGTIRFDGTTVEFVRSGMGRLLVGTGSKRIPLSAISAVSWKPADGFGGILGFTIAGGIELRSPVGRQVYDAMADENSVTFNKKQAAAMVQVRDAIEAAIAARNAPPPAPAAAYYSGPMTPQQWYPEPGTPADPWSQAPLT